MNPKKMQAVMKQMGINQSEIDANRVVIECDDKKIIIDEPSVVKINMQGQENFQISGDVSEIAVEEDSEEEDTSDEDVAVIVEKAGCSEDEARSALEKADGDLTEALLGFG